MALEKKRYSIVLDIVRNEKKIKAETFKRCTEDFGANVISEIISHGCEAVLAEIVRRFPDFEMGEKIVVPKNPWGDGRQKAITPLYHAVNSYYLGNLSPDGKLNYCIKTYGPPQGLITLTEYDKNILRESLESQLPRNAQGIVNCIDFLIKWHQEHQITLDTPNIEGHSALTLAVECRLHKITRKLLEAGANVNHKTNKNGSCSRWALLNQDRPMLELLAKYGADPIL
jgi:hypothetical protein